MNWKEQVTCRMSQSYTEILQKPQPLSFCPLPLTSLYKSRDPKAIPFRITADRPSVDDEAPQDRALEAIAFGTSVRSKG